MIIGVLGSGIVGSTLANGLRSKGHDVSIGNRKGNTVDNWDGEVGTYADISAKSEMVIIAVKGTAAQEVVISVKDNLAHKTVIDTTNPIAETAPDEGVLHYFTTLEDSLMERLQAEAPEANFVKSFSCVGNAQMIDPEFEGAKPTMFICGNNENAKQEVSQILSQLGWESEDFGGLKSARAIEPLCMLWCIPGMLRNEWSHAFKLLKA